MLATPTAGDTFPKVEKGCLFFLTAGRIPDTLSATFRAFANTARRQRYARIPVDEQIQRGYRVHPKLD